MYMNYYGFSANPFRLSPDPHFFFTSTTHKSAFAYLRYGLHQGEGFVVVTGAAGAGKTTLMLALLAKLSNRDMVIGKLVTTQLQPDDLVRSITAAFHLDAQGTKAELIARLQEFLLTRTRMKQRVLLVVDEAHNLPQDSFEELRMLSNFQQGASALLQCILLGQPPLWDMLTRSNMEQLQQRVIAAHQLHPLNAEETRGYILHRLRQAGWRGDPDFSASAIKLIHRYCHGIPRRINSLCDRILLFGALEERHHIDADVLAQVYNEWAMETGQDAFAETLPQWQSDEINLAGLGNEHAVVAQVVGADTVPLPQRPGVAPHDSTAFSPSRVSSTRPPDLEPASEETINSTTTAPLTPLAALRPMLKAMAGVGAAVVIIISVIAIWSGRGDKPQPPAGDEITYSSASQVLQAAVTPQPPPAADMVRGQNATSQTVSTMATASVAENLPETPAGTPILAQKSDHGKVEAATASTTATASAAENLPETPAGAPIPAQKSDHGKVETVTASATPASPVAEQPPAAPRSSPPAAVESRHVAAATSKPAKATAQTPKRDHADEVKNKTPRHRDSSSTEPIRTATLTPQASESITTNGRSARAKHDGAATVPQASAATPPVPVNLAGQETNSGIATKPAAETAQTAAPDADSSSDKGPAAARPAETATTPEQAHAEGISAEALALLLTRFKGAYDAGDMNALTRLFATDASSDDAHDRAAIAAAYQKLFDTTDRRDLALDAIRWISAGAAMQGEGPFAVKVREKGRGLESSYSGHLSLRIEKRNGRPVITRLEYFYTR
jgi:general secretion pathway protein A